MTDADTPTRPGLGMTPEARAFHLAMARQAIDEHAAAVRALRLLEAVAAGPKISVPRTIARNLRTLADELDETAPAVARPVERAA